MCLSVSVEFLYRGFLSSFHGCWLLDLSKNVNNGKKINVIRVTLSWKFYVFKAKLQLPFFRTWRLSRQHFYLEPIKFDAKSAILNILEKTTCLCVTEVPPLEPNFSKLGCSFCRNDFRNDTAKLCKLRSFGFNCCPLYCQSWVINNRFPSKIIAFSPGTEEPSDQQQGKHPLKDALQTLLPKWGCVKLAQL